MEENDGGWGFKSVHETYLCAQDDGEFVSNRERLGGFETFQLTRINFTGTYFFKTAHENYVSPQEDDSVTLAEEAAKITIIDAEEGRVALINSYGKYCAATADG